MEQTQTNDKVILTLLCNDLYYQIKEIVNQYAHKQTEKDIVNAEETFIRVIYRDFVDSDIFNDFAVLFFNDFYIINQFKNSKKGDKQSLQVAVDNITKFLQSEDCKSQIKSVCAKYKYEQKADRILSESIRKVGIYLPQLTQDQSDKFRNCILKLFKMILTFCSQN